MADAFGDLDRAREAVLAEGAAFTGALEPALGQSLRRGFERFCADHAQLVLSLDGPTREALEKAVDRSIDEGVAAVVERLRSPEIWLSPLTASDLPPRHEWMWPGWLPEWLSGMFRGKTVRDSLGDLDDPSNRIWIAICAASGPLDATLEEFGFRPGRPRIGGGRFDVGPRTLPRLDPTGVLQGPWRRYRVAFGRLSALTADPEGRAALGP